MPTKLSQTDTIFHRIEAAANQAIEEFPKVGLSIEVDKRGKHPSMTIRVMPAVKVKERKPKGEAK